MLICLATALIKASYSQDVKAQPLNGVTFGFGAGYSYTFDETYDYSLTTDGNYNLTAQGLSKGGFVISTVIMVKLAKLTYQPGDATKSNLRKSSDRSKSAEFFDRFSINLALNLIDVKPDVSFNKNIDGGLGFGFFFNDNLQLAAFYDVSRIRQLRDYVMNSYMNRPIPNGAGKIYNALDPANNDLFYYKTISGISLKLVYSIGNKKQSL